MTVEMHSHTSLMMMMMMLSVAYLSLENSESLDLTSFVCFRTFSSTLYFKRFIIYSVIFTAIGVPNIPRTIGVIQPIILFLMIAISRGFARFWLGDGKNYFEFIGKKIL